jgi:hypothetical protein
MKDWPASEISAKNRRRIAAVLLIVSTAACSTGGGSSAPSPTVSAAPLTPTAGPALPVAITAALQPGDDVGQTTFTEVDGRVERRGTIWTPTLTASDPRLEGTVRLSSPQDAYPGADGPESFVFRSGTWRIETTDGAWQGSDTSFEVGDMGGGSTLIVAGEGAYAGLYAALDMTDGSNIRGVIFPAPPPPIPDVPRSSGASTAPSAPAAGPADPVSVTAALRPGDDIGTTTYTEVDGRVERRGTVWAPTITASDTRLEGTMALGSPQDTYPGANGPESFVFGSGAWRIENADGAWQGSSSSFALADVAGGETVVLAGEGAYAGLYAALDVTDPGNIRGVIFPAPPPPVPGAP